MTLQALKDDLAQAPEGYPVTHGSAVEVARRVAALYDTCAWCGGTGYVNPQGAAFGDGPCSGCGGTGMVGRIGRRFDPEGLAAYLFGDTP
jgi:hypothetical protein